jgi:hypothetical protein
LTAIRIHIISLLVLTLMANAQAQELPVIRNQGGRMRSLDQIGQMGMGSMGGGMMRGVNSGATTKDSLKRRDKMGIQ